MLSVFFFAMLLGAVLFIYWGLYDVAAVQQHTRPVYWLLDIALRRSIQMRAEEIAAPRLDDPALIRRGLYLFRQKCVVCHGAPGVARDDMGKGLTPLPGDLALIAKEWSAEEIYWTVRHGIKMTGMPAWEFEFDDSDLWSVVAFVRRLPRLSPLEYREMSESIGAEPPAVRLFPERPSSPSGDPARGRLIFQHYACSVCHRVREIVGPNGDVGPPLDGIAGRKYIAGVLPNSFENMVRWIADPQEVDPLTAMPDLDVREADARDIAAFLLTLRRP